MLKMSKKFKEEIFDWLPSGEQLADRVNAAINESQHDEDCSEPYLTPLSLSEVRGHFIQQLQIL